MMQREKFITRRKRQQILYEHSYSPKPQVVFNTMCCYYFYEYKLLTKLKPKCTKSYSETLPHLL